MLLCLQCRPKYTPKLILITEGRTPFLLDATKGTSINTTYEFIYSQLYYCVWIFSYVICSSLTTGHRTLRWNTFYRHILMLCQYNRFYFILLYISNVKYVIITVSNSLDWILTLKVSWFGLQTFKDYQHWLNSFRIWTRVFRIIGISLKEVLREITREIILWIKTITKIQ